MQASKPPARDPGLDGVRTNPRIEELTSRDHAVLPASQSDDLLVDPRRGYVDIGTSPCTD
jgi:hypothetical protein